MKESIKNLHVSDIGNELTRQQYIHVGDYSIALKMAHGYARNVRNSELYRVTEGRVIVVLSGSADCMVNLHDYHLTAGSALVILPQSLVSFSNSSEDYRLMGLTFAKMPSCEMPRECFVLSLNETDNDRVQRLFLLIDEYMRMRVPQMQAAENMVNTLLSDLCSLYRAIPAPIRTRAQGLMNDFLTLLAAEGSVRHGIPYYADKLCVTPNYLSTVVVGQSGQTVMQWIDRTLLMEAQILLLHTQLPIADIAYRLGFADATLFCRFFKRETGMTAREYKTQ